MAWMRPKTLLTYMSSTAVVTAPLTRMVPAPADLLALWGDIMPGVRCGGLRERLAALVAHATGVQALGVRK